LPQSYGTKTKYFHTRRYCLAQALVVFPIVAIASWLNWGLGLVVGAFLAREIARRVKVDFAWLAAGSYSAWSVCNSGLSSSLALSQASHGNVLNLVEKATGQVVPLSQTVFAPFPTVLVVVVMTAIFIKMHPSSDQVVVFRETSTETTTGGDPHARDAGTASFASRIERSMLGTLLLLALGVGYLVMLWHDKGFELDINTTILIFMLVGLALQRSPIAYADAIRRAARQTGSMLLQYPMYGGIMGIMSGTGLASVIAKAFVAIATPATLALWSYLSSLIITLLIPMRWRTLGRAGAFRPACCASPSPPSRAGVPSALPRRNGKRRWPPEARNKWPNAERVP
jgi:short-chain fatty acids transporter